jgi:hypothetical protein
VGGSLVGGGNVDTDPAHAGQVVAAGIGRVRVAGSVQGGAGASSARITSDGPIAGIFVGGSVLGSDGTESARIGAAGAVGPVRIGGDVRGGGLNSGLLFSNTSLGDVRIGGSLVGGPGGNGGTIQTPGPLGRVTVGRDLRGGSAASQNLSGGIIGDRIAGVTIGGSVYASTTAGVDNTAIRALEVLGPVLVRGSLVGNATNRVLIEARGSLVPVGPIDVAIQSLTVLGRVERADVLAGYLQNTAISGEAQIGAVTVGGDWIASNLVAGAKAGADGQFGTADDAPIGPGDPAIPKIASVAVGGQVLGTVGGSDHFGFVSQQIGSFRVNGISLPMHPGPGNDLAGLAVGPTGDVTVREVA